MVGGGGARGELVEHDVVAPSEAVVFAFQMQGDARAPAPFGGGAGQHRGIVARRGIVEDVDFDRPVRGGPGQHALDTLDHQIGGAVVDDDHRDGGEGAGGHPVSKSVGAGDSGPQETVVFYLTGL